MADSKDEGRLSAPAVITTAITIAGFAFLYLNQRQSLSFGEQLLFAAIIGVSAVAFFVWIWYRPLSNWKGRWRRNRIAHRHFSQLITFSERLGDFIKGGTVANPSYFLHELKGVKDFSGMQIPFPSYAQQLYMDLERGLRLQKRSLRTFVWGADSLDSLIRFYNEVYLLDPVKEVRTMISAFQKNVIPDEVPEVPEHIREGFNGVRNMFVRFLQDYELFVSQVSKELGNYRIKVLGDWQNLDYLRGTHFEPPQELPGPLATF